VKDLPLLATPLTVTTALPVAAPVGTLTFMDVALHEVYVLTDVPLNFTVLLPRLEPKFEPVIVTDVPSRKLEIGSLSNRHTNMTPDACEDANLYYG
jgi:hypothetical protein